MLLQINRCSQLNLCFQCMVWLNNIDALALACKGYIYIYMCVCVCVSFASNKVGDKIDIRPILIWIDLEPSPRRN